MPIQIGNAFPRTTLVRATAHGTPELVDTYELFKAKRVVLFSIIGAFTETCSAHHLPGYLKRHAELRNLGVNLIACLSVNDADVMGAWARAQGVRDEVEMLADGDARLTKALGIDIEIPGMGVRAARGVFVVDNGVVTSVELEKPLAFDVSSAESCAGRLQRGPRG